MLGLFFKWLRYPTFLIFLLLLGPGSMLISCSVNLSNDWSQATRQSAQLAPAPANTPEAIVQVYAARAYHWRGLFAVHTWIAVKAQNSNHYVTHQVIGWGAHRGRSNVYSRIDQPDRYWFGNPPEILVDIRGKEAQKLIPKIERAVQSYPHSRQYTAWPGPNSNTFVAHVGRQVPELQLAMPPHAIGKDYLPNESLVAATPSGTGYQFSVYGLLGVVLAEHEGLEFNVLGLSFGFDPLGPALKLPGVGRVGFDHHHWRSLLGLDEKTKETQD